VPRFGRRHLAQVGLEAQVPPEHVCPRAQERDLDHPAAPGLAPLEHGRQKPGQRGQAADVVTDAAARVERHPLGVGGQLDRQAGTGPEGADVVGRPVAVLPAQPVPADAAVDQTGVAGHRGLGLQTEPVERVRTQVREEDVGGREECFELIPGLRLAQVEDDTAFPPVVLGEGRVGEVVAADPQRPERVAHGIARRWLHLDDVGPPVGQQGRRRWGGHPHPELDHPQAAQGLQAHGFGIGHADTPFCCTCGAVARRRSSSFTTLPVAFTGSASTISTARGTL
jgi:hypothetical protein